jgi:hypothetical protein
VKEAYTAAEKDTGVVRFAASNTLNLEIDRDKTVKWDQGILKDVLNALPPEDSRHYAKVTVEVESKKFDAAPPAIKKQLAAARTVIPGRNKFTFKDAKIAA